MTTNSKERRQSAKQVVVEFKGYRGIGCFFHVMYMLIANIIKGTDDSTRYGEWEKKLRKDFKTARINRRVLTIGCLYQVASKQISVKP